MVFYVDTSFWGGAEDDEFSGWTLPFFDHVRNGEFKIILSDVTIRELVSAPDKVRQLPDTIPDHQLILESINEDQLELAQRYIDEGVLTNKFETDAQHISIATILKADILVSWNFRHMVNFFKIQQYNSINLKFGYSTIDIRTPKEIIYGNDD